MEQILINTATPLTDSKFTESPNNGYGHGLVNAYEAVSAVTEGLGKAEGRVGKEGEDSKPPVLTHEPFKEVFQVLTFPLQLKLKTMSALRQSNWPIKSILPNGGLLLANKSAAITRKERLKRSFLLWMAKSFPTSGSSQTSAEIKRSPIYMKFRSHLL